MTEIAIVNGYSDTSAMCWVRVEGESNLMMRLPGSENSSVTMQCTFNTAKFSVAIYGKEYSY